MNKRRKKQIVIIVIGLLFLLLGISCVLNDDISLFFRNLGAFCVGLSLFDIFIRD